MKFLAFLTIFSATFIGSFSIAAIPLQSFDYSGYLRGGSGSNLKGGVQECFNNSGAPANEMRLGNECGYYGEIAFTAHHLKAKSNSDPYFFSQVRFSFSPKGYRQWEKSDVDNRGVNLTEGFVEAGRVENLPYTYWLGKRFYRQIDAHIDDWYYFADTSGVGAGIDQISVTNGTLAIAHILQTSDTATSAGQPQLQFVDVRWNDIQLDPGQKLYVWTGYGWAPRGTSGATNYVATRGWLLGARYNWQLEKGFNDFAVLYGKGVMNGLNLYGTNPATDEAVNRASKFRIVENFVKDINAKWSVMTVWGVELTDSGALSDSSSQWQGLAVRPIYFINDHYQLVTELGYSRVKVDSEVDGAGNKVGTRELTRLTIAPQISMERNIWSRPVMRVYFTQSFWNSANQSKISGNAPSFAQDLQGSAFGYQFEVWF